MSFKRADNILIASVYFLLGHIFHTVEETGRYYVVGHPLNYKKNDELIKQPEHCIRMDIDGEVTKKYPGGTSLPELTCPLLILASLIPKIFVSGYISDKVCNL